MDARSLSPPTDRLRTRVVPARSRSRSRSSNRRSVSRGRLIRIAPIHSRTQDVFDDDESEGSSPDSSVRSSIALPSPFYPAGLDGSAEKRLPRTITGDGAELLPPVPLQPEASVRTERLSTTLTRQTVLEDDLKTPDNWIPRDSRMVRLTGKVRECGQTALLLLVSVLN